MPRRVFLLCLAATALLLPTLAVPAGASVAGDHVSRVVLKDPPGDVWAIGDGEDDEWVSAGDVPTADVIRAGVRHGRRVVVVRMTFTNLRRVEPQDYSAMIVSRRHFRLVRVSAGPGRWKGRHLVVDGRFSPVRCPGLRHSVDYEAEQVTMRVPRSCLGKPRWVRVGMQNFIFRETRRTFQEITDNPHSTRSEGPLTRRLYRALR